MKKLMEQMKRLVRDEEGATAVEYGIMVALIAAVVIAGAQLLGTNTNATLLGVAGVMPAPPAAP